jgi:hypothetical protein
MHTAAEETGCSDGAPSAEALLAGTLALMTGHAQELEAGLRVVMARKISSNLFFLALHPDLSEAFRSALSRMRLHWLAQMACTEGGAALDAWPDVGALH